MTCCSIRRSRVSGVARGALVTATIAMAACLVSSNSAFAISSSWGVDASGDWNVGANWLSGTIAAGNGFTATFANDITADRTVSLASVQSRAVGSLVFGDANTASAASWILDRISPYSLTLNNGSGTNAVITVNDLGAGATATIALPLGASASPAIEKNGPGTLVLSNAGNPFVANLLLTAGTLQVGVDGNLGATANDITLNGGTLRTTAGFTMNSSRDITVGPNGGTLDVSGTLTVPGLLSGTSSSTLAKNGSGTLVLSNTVANTFAGKTSVAAGVLQISNNNQLGANPGSYLADAISLSNGATLQTSAGVTLNANRGMTIGSGGGSLAVNGGLLTYDGRFSGAGQTVTVTGASGLSLGNSSGTATDVNWVFSQNNGVRTFFAGSNALGTGSVQVGSGVRLVSQNTAPTAGQVTNAVTLLSGAGITARSTAGAVTYTNVTFPASGSVVLNKDDTTTSILTISSGGTITGNLSVDLSPNGGNPVADVILSGIFTGAGGVEKSGTGATGILRLAGANTYTGNTTISTGTLKLDSTGSVATSGTISVASGATFDVSAASFAVGSGQVLSGSGTILGSFSFGNGSKFAYDFSAGVPMTAANTVSFPIGSIFGADDVLGLSSSTPEGTYTLIAGTVDLTNLQNVGSGNAYVLGGGKSAYFQSGSLQLVVVPEPGICISGFAGFVVFALSRSRTRA